MHSLRVVKPDVTDEVARGLVDRLYGLNVTSTRLMDSFDDTNYHIQVSDEHRNPHLEAVSADGYTLKILNTEKSAESDQRLKVMLSTMLHLHKKGLRVPLQVRNVEGGPYKLEKVPIFNKTTGEWEQHSCVVYLLTFLRGVTVGSITYTKDVLYQWGRLLAEFHDATEGCHFQLLDQEKLFWTLEHIPEIRDFMDGLDERKTKLVEGVLDRYHEEIGKKINSLSRGTLHGDFNESNLIAVLSSKDKEPKYIVNGILDYEDVHQGTYVWDVGVMLAYTLLYCTTMDPLEGAGYALAGYRSRRPMDNEISMIKICIESRLCQSLVLCAYRYRIEPHNEYLMTSGKFGWERLEQICSISNDNLLSKWRSVEFREIPSDKAN